MTAVVVLVDSPRRWKILTERLVRKSAAILPGAALEAAAAWRGNHVILLH